MLESSDCAGIGCDVDVAVAVCQDQAVFTSEVGTGREAYFDQVPDLCPWSGYVEGESCALGGCQGDDAK